MQPKSAGSNTRYRSTREMEESFPTQQYYSRIFMYCMPLSASLSACCTIFSSCSANESGPRTWTRRLGIVGRQRRTMQAEQECRTSQERALLLLTLVEIAESEWMAIDRVFWREGKCTTNKARLLLRITRKERSRRYRLQTRPRHVEWTAAVHD